MGPQDRADRVRVERGRRQASAEPAGDNKSENSKNSKTWPDWIFGEDIEKKIFEFILTVLVVIQFALAFLILLSGLEALKIAVQIGSPYDADKLIWAIFTSLVSLAALEKTKTWISKQTCSSSWFQLVYFYFTSSTIFSRDSIFWKVILTVLVAIQCVVVALIAVCCGVMFALIGEETPCHPFTLANVFILLVFFVCLEKMKLYISDKTGAKSFFHDIDWSPPKNSTSAHHFRTSPSISQPSSSSSSCFSTSSSRIASGFGGTKRRNSTSTHHFWTSPSISKPSSISSSCFSTSSSRIASGFGGTKRR